MGWLVVVTLADAIELHRAMLRDELRIPRMTSQTPPRLRPDGTTTRVALAAAAVQDGTTGVYLSARMLRLLGPADELGEAFPWQYALHQTRYWCRRQHEYHRAADRPYWRGSLCWQAVTLTVVDGLSLLNAQAILRYDHLEPVLRLALEHIEEQMDRQRDRAAQREKHDRGVFRVGEQAPPAHHSVPGLHMEECPQCRKIA